MKHVMMVKSQVQAPLVVVSAPGVIRPAGHAIHCGSPGFAVYVDCAHILGEVAPRSVTVLPGGAGLHFSKPGSSE